MSDASNESVKSPASAVPDLVESHLLPNGDHTAVPAPAESCQQATADPGTGENIQVIPGDITGKIEQAESPQATSKKKPGDFHFGKIIGSGSYSEVVLAHEKSTGQEFAIKILEKSHIIKYKKVPSVTREKEVLQKLEHPFFVRLFFTFQDKERLYFGLTYAKKGELLHYIKRVGCFDIPATQFYSAEIIVALEYMHSRGIIHRDLKPENILLGESMHILITDFGTAKILDEGQKDCRANSFVGTAEYVSPELLTAKSACKASDIWALGCIVYQLLAGKPPFHATTEYLVFQRITKLDLDIPGGFPEVGSDLVTKLLVLDPTQRLGSESFGGYELLKAHDFYNGINWEQLHQMQPPAIQPFLPMTSEGKANIKGANRYSKLEIDMQLKIDIDTLSMNMGLESVSDSEELTIERREQLDKQASSSPWHKYVPNELIVKNGQIEKRKGLFAKKRELILTDGPRLIYIDPVGNEVKGEIPWSTALNVEVKNLRTFFIHTPSRTYYLEDLNNGAQAWADAIDQFIKK